MSLFGNRDTGGYHADGRYPRDEDPNVAWVRHQVELAFMFARPDPRPRGDLARIAITISVLTFLVLVITLALCAPR